MENAGNNTTGPLGTTPPTHTANGIEITQNNGAVHITGVSINGVTKSAILTSGPMTVVNGGSAVNCGVGLASGERNGVFVAGGSAIVTNYSAGNTPGVTYQQYGVFLGPASSNNIVIANDLHYKDGNTVVGLFDGSSVPTSNTLLSNKGDPQSKLSVPTVLSKGYTVATLPTATTTLLGARAFVTDASSPTFGAALTGGGSLVTPVYCNGGLWLVG